MMIMQELIAVVENSQDLILLFTMPMGTRKGFFEICRQFGYSPSRRYAGPGPYKGGVRTLYFIFL